MNGQVILVFQFSHHREQTVSEEASDCITEESPETRSVITKGGHL